MIDSSGGGNSEIHTKLGARIEEYLTPWEQISLDKKERLSGIAELICEAARSGDFATAKEYWKNARFQDPVSANSAFYDNYNTRIAGSYLSYVNNEMSRIKWEVPTLGFNNLEIGISNAEHYDPYHPMLGFAKARLLIRKANNIGSYDAHSCLSEAEQIIWDLHHRMENDERLQNDNYESKLSRLRGEHNFISRNTQNIRDTTSQAGALFVFCIILGFPLTIYGIMSDTLSIVCCSLPILLLGLYSNSIQEQNSILMQHDSG